jgi:hypothetical protein
MPGSSTTPGRPSACVGALGHIAFHYTDSVGTRNQFSIAAQWLACTIPCRRFADILTDACARLGADVVRYSFIVVDLHHLLLAGLPAHLCKNAKISEPPRIIFLRSSKSDTLKNSRRYNCDSEKRSFYRRRAPLRFYTAKTQSGHRSDPLGSNEGANSRPKM